MIEWEKILRGKERKKSSERKQGIKEEDEKKERGSEKSKNKYLKNSKFDLALAFSKLMTPWPSQIVFGHNVR